jgi:superfamily I DNA and/or RNA helicase
MTTTGVAKYKKLINRVDSKIMIVEEAAQILESHMATSLTPKIEHLILIGDHEQLRPSNNVYELSKRYNLDISMFERLINNNFENVMLKNQRRMRP